MRPTNCLIAIFVAAGCSMLIGCASHLIIVDAADNDPRVIVPPTCGRSGDSLRYRKGEQPRLVQPDPAAWARIRKGLTLQEAKVLLGEPTDQSPEEPVYPTNVGTIVCRWLSFGKIEYATPEMCGSESFLIFVDQFGLVYDKCDPFGGDASLDGSPVAPTVLAPAERTNIPGYPRWADLRWKPGAGRYPLSYEVEVQVSQLWEFEDERTLTRSWWGIWSPEVPAFAVEEPYLPTCLPGKGEYRWRVRAKNELGTSAWTEWRR